MHAPHGAPQHDDGTSPSSPRQRHRRQSSTASLVADSPLKSPHQQHYRPDSPHHSSQHHPDDPSLSPNSVKRHDHDASANPQNSDHRTPKPKQKRNKPTLSCKECVDRKTKCDRGRPQCLACLKRSTHCQYTQIADILASSAEHDKPRKSRKASKPSGPDARSKASIANITNPLAMPGPGMQDQFGPPFSATSHSIPSAFPPPQFPVPSDSTMSLRLSALAMPNNAAVDVFGMGGEHPFANYWTATGGVAEVLGVLPSKEQADILVSKYFEIMDPMYPVVDQEDYMEHYERFWSIPLQERANVQPDMLALHFVIYATSTQFIEQASPESKTKTAEFYISAAHQALRISSYWSHITIPTVQAMTMTFYFLINDNHVSDAWTFAGITVRQAYVLQLNRDPEQIVPHASRREKHMRLKLWQAIMHQDAAIAMFLKMPPAAISSDIGACSYDVDVNQEYTRNNRMSLGTFSSVSPAEDRMVYDMGFAKSMWIFSNFIQENVCKRRALGLPLANSSEHKRELVSSFKALRLSFPKPFSSLDPKRFEVQNQRLAREQISLSSNYYHTLMLLCVDENPEAKVAMDVWGTLEAAHEGLLAFFAMNHRFGGEVNGFWAYQHRAFEMAITIASLLDVDQKPPLPSTSGNSIGQAHLLLKTAKEDVRHMLEVIRQSSGYFEFQHVQERRLDVLQAVYDRIRIV